MSLPGHILLVEDSPADVELTLHAFASNRMTNEIKIARDGEEALAELEHEGAETPALILLDLKLPKIDGLDVLARIKANPRLRHVPVVVLTSSKEERDLLASYERGVNSYIVKPVDFEKFGEAVRLIGFYWLLLNEPPRTAPD